MPDLHGNAGCGVLVQVFTVVKLLTLQVVTGKSSRTAYRFGSIRESTSHIVTDIAYELYFFLL